MALSLIKDEDVLPEFLLRSKRLKKIADEPQKVYWSTKPLQTMYASTL